LIERYYMDTSAIVKRYVDESGSRLVDRVFEKAHKDLAIIVSSYWNIGESAVVFDKYEKLGLNASEIFKTMLRELRMLCRARSAVLINVTPRLIRESIKYIFKHHIYIADALQIASAKQAHASKFLTGDKRLTEISRNEGLETIHLT